MTVLLYAKDHIKQKFNLSDIKIFFDEQNPTNEEEVLQEQAISEVLLKPKDGEEIKIDVQLILLQAIIEQESQEEPDTIYVNNKSQLIKITQVERNGRDTELHQILSFNIDTLPQAKQHNYGLDGQINVANPFKAPMPRVKVPVKDGMSQNKFIQHSKQIQELVKNANEIFYSEEEVAKHNKESDCWTIFNGRIYDITQYAKVHPGGKKIFLGKGKDCTDLFNKYHPWVNTQFLIGKYQVGVLKRSG